MPLRRDFNSNRLVVATALLAALVVGPVLPRQCSACGQAEERDCCQRPAAVESHPACCQRTPAVVSNEIPCGCSGCAADNQCQSCPGWQEAQTYVVLSAKALDLRPVGMSAYLPADSTTIVGPAGLETGFGERWLSAQAPTVPHRILHCSWLI